MLRHLWWVGGLLLVGGGLVLAVAAQTSPDDFGWFAYTPLSESPDWSMGWGSDGTTSAWVVTPWQVVGAAVAALGVLVIGAGAGYRLGSRRGRRGERGPAQLTT